MTEENTRLENWTLTRDKPEVSFETEPNELFVRGFNSRGSDFAVLVLIDGFFEMSLGEGETDTEDLPIEPSTVTVKALGEIGDGQEASGDLEFFRVGKDRRKRRF